VDGEEERKKGKTDDGKRGRRRKRMLKYGSWRRKKREKGRRM